MSSVYSECDGIKHVICVLSILRIKACHLCTHGDYEDFTLKEDLVCSHGGWAVSTFSNNLQTGTTFV